MNNVFAFNVKTNQLSAEEFLIRKPDSEFQRKWDEAREQLAFYQKKGSMPLWYCVIEFLGLLLSVIFLPAFMDSCTEIGFETAYARGSWALYIGAVCLVLWLVMFILSKVRAHRVKTSPEVDSFVSGIGELAKKIKENLRVPGDCADVDVLCRTCKITASGKEKRGSLYFPYLNSQMWVFKEGENLCFADTSGVYALPLAHITEIAKIKKSVNVPLWNKNEPVKSEKYKRIARTNNNGMYFIKIHYSVRFTRHGEEWEVLIPAYDIEPIMLLTGITPAE